MLSPLFALEKLKSTLNPSVLILGTGVTGRAVARKLAKLNIAVTLLDQKSVDENSIKAAVGIVLFDSGKMQIIDKFENKPEQILTLKSNTFSIAISSPGISARNPLIKICKELEIPVISELDFSFSFLPRPTVAVTGTNGKTTVVSLIHQILVAGGLDSKLVGNVGEPFINLVEDDVIRATLLGEEPQLSKKVLVAELSSYQLETATDFRPHLGVFLNLDDDHLERHSSVDEYFSCKSKIFKAQNTEDVAVVNISDVWGSKLVEQVKERLLAFGLKEDAKDYQSGCFFDSKENRIELRISGREEFFSCEKTKLIGKHNKLNICACIVVASKLGIGSDIIQKVVDDFVPLPHRIEPVRTVNGVLYVNDSKGTNVSAVVSALETFEQEYTSQRIILLLGGEKKLGSWQNVQNLIKKGIKAVIAFGKDGGAILDELDLKLEGENFCDVYLTTTLSQAVRQATAIGNAKDVVLLSPGCASFDAYRNYEERGEDFRRIVANL